MSDEGSDETEALSCDVTKYREQLCAEPGRKAITFVGKDFPGTEGYLNALAEADGKGFFGEMTLGVLPVDSEECDHLAEAEGVEELPRTVVYDCKEGRLVKVGVVSPSQDDTEYRQAIERLIDLSEE